jgi:hypothetical protein
VSNHGGETDEDAMEFENGTGVFPDVTKSGSDLIDMVFRKTRVEDRKKWLNDLEKDTFLDYSKAQENGVLYSDFINKEFILFSKSDCERSIPHVMDGFKPSQRKALFACFKRKLKDEIKVAQLAGYIGEHSAYHHGEASLHGTSTSIKCHSLLSLCCFSPRHISLPSLTQSLTWPSRFVAPTISTC